MFGIDTLFYIYLAAAAVSAAYSYDQSRKSAKAQEQAGLYQKMAADQKARNTALETAEADRRMRVNKKRQLARLRAGMAGTSGLVMEGSLEDAFTETAGRLELEILDANRRGAMEAANQQSAGDLALWEARTQAVATRVEATGSLLSSVGSIASGAYTGRKKPAAAPAGGSSPSVI
jgi:hypothetical protein